MTLTQLGASGNALTGSLPHEWHTLTTLTFLRLGSNSINGGSRAIATQAQPARCCCLMHRLCTCRVSARIMERAAAADAAAGQQLSCRLAAAQLGPGELDPGHPRPTQQPSERYCLSCYLLCAGHPSALQVVCECISLCLSGHCNEFRSTCTDVLRFRCPCTLMDVAFCLIDLAMTLAVGTLPAAWASMQSLTTLDLQNNTLTGAEQSGCSPSAP